MAVRFNIEPQLCRLAAQQATSFDCERLRICADRCRAAKDWRTYEAWDNDLQHAIARATRNQHFQYFFEALNSVHRSIVCGQPRASQRPDPNYSSFAEHDAIISAISAGNGDLVTEMMTLHLNTVTRRFLPEHGLSGA